MGIKWKRESSDPRRRSFISARKDLSAISWSCEDERPGRGWCACATISHGVCSALTVAVAGAKTRGDALKGCAAALRGMCENEPAPHLRERVERWLQKDGL